MKLKSFEFIYEDKPTLVKPESIELETKVDFSKLKVNFPELRVTILEFSKDQLHITTRSKTYFYSDFSIVIYLIFSPRKVEEESTFDYF